MMSVYHRGVTTAGFEPAFAAVRRAVAPPPPNPPRRNRSRRVRTRLWKYLPMGSVVRRAAGQLFVGTLVIVIDLRINRFDLINDVIGILLVVSGLTLLAGLPPSRATERFDLARNLAIFSAVLTVLEQFVDLDAGSDVWPVNLVASLIGLVGVLLMADGFRRLATDHQVPPLIETWELSFRLLLFGAFVPVVLLDLAGIVVWLANDGRRVNFETPLAFIAVLLALVPLVHLLMSLHRTQTLAATFDPAPTLPTP